jgi:heme/copper-type cytochrome/quinol oxidase subunit 2
MVSTINGSTMDLILWIIVPIVIVILIAVILYKVYKKLTK